MEARIITYIKVQISSFFNSCY